LYWIVNKTKTKIEESRLKTSKAVKKGGKKLTKFEKGGKKSSGFRWLPRLIRFALCIVNYQNATKTALVQKISENKINQLFKIVLTFWN
jgi:hypothetical protein